MPSLRGHDAVVPVIRGYPEPLFAVYSKTVIKYAEKALRYGRPRLQELFKDLDVLYMDESEAKEYDPGLLSFINVNTPEELKMAEGLAKGRGNLIISGRKFRRLKIVRRDIRYR